MTTRFYSKQIDVEDAAKIELERTTVPEGAIFEPYSEVEDVAGKQCACLLIFYSKIPLDLCKLT